MAYGQYYQPMGYQIPSYMGQMQMSQNQVPTPQVQTPPTTQMSQGLNWVQGEAGAKSWIVGRGETVLLMDSENSVFYLKSTDNAGMPLPLRIFDYTERTHNATELPQAVSNNMSEQFVTREEYETLNGKYEELLQRVADLQKPKTNSRKKEVNPDE